MTTAAPQTVRIALLQRKDEINAFEAWLALQQPQRILEIGAHQGGTAIIWCERAPTLVISVDLPGGAGGGISFDECLARNQMIRGRFPQFRGVLGDSHDPRTQAGVAEWLGGAQVDLLFIDGDHTATGVRQDFEMYRGFVRPGGVVAFHDINDTPSHRELGCLVHEFWHEVRQQYPSWEFNAHGEWGGIGVVQL